MKYPKSYYYKLSIKTLNKHLKNVEQKYNLISYYLGDLTDKERVNLYLKEYRKEINFLLDLIINKRILKEEESIK